MSDNKEEEHNRAKQEAGFFPASGEITAPSGVHHPTERRPQISETRPGYLGAKGKQGGFDLIFVNVRHFVTADGEIYSGLCTI